MDLLPPELVTSILKHLPKRSLSSARLVCHTFNMLSFPLIFSHIPQWLNYEVSHRAVISLANDLYNRPVVMWSPWATGPDGAVDEVWMLLVWKVLMKGEAPVLSVFEAREKDRGEMKAEIGGERKKLTASNFAEMSGRSEMSENRLTTGQNRFLLHPSYTEGSAD